eukprot:TRINITY_DN2579_c0_g1_i6.p1 TRINITY_DN2579_c0_g1~~TRINITY_DN2579_c0_g1_i6.p1  ORF type:complete len:493 (+),score=117.99 TRINITY_DN2579_c0_g1_i6:45-1523(+)
MKVLIVNGYSDTPAGREAFKRFVAIVKKSFEYLRVCGMDEPVYVVLDYKNVRTYIYEKNTKYDNPEAGRLFDSTDFLMMDGDANLLPWVGRAKLFGMLFKQAKRCNKAIFAAGFAFYQLIFYCATNCMQVNIINGNGWGSRLEEIRNFSGQGLPRNAGFLDYETGDIYTYSNERNMWMPMGNTGLHYNRKVSSDTIGQFMQNVKVYRGKPGIKDIYDVYKSNNNEAVCFIRKSYVQHWVFAGLPQKFVVIGKNAWDPHPVNVTQAGLVGLNYHTLADNEKGPSVIEHKNTVATLFHIDASHPETVKVLDNFVRHNIGLIQEHGRIDMPLELAELREKAALSDPAVFAAEAKKVENLARKHRVSAEALKTERYTTEFKRSGYSYSKRLQSLVVGNNAVRMLTFEAPVRKKSALPKTARDTPNTQSTKSAANFFATELSRPQTVLTQSKPESSRNYMQTPSECPQTVRAITKILHPFIPEEFLSDNTQVTPLEL